MRKMKIACIGNYVPRQCGIATFTRDLVSSMINNDKKNNIKADAYIIAMNDGDQNYDYPEEVKQVIRQEEQADYLKAAKYINFSDANVCLLQHEFGIFGGECGIYILPLIHRLNIPIIVTFHTILKEPTYSQKAIVHEIGKEAMKVVVMSNLAIDFLTDIYNVPKEKIALVEHGVPDISFTHSKHNKKKYNLENKKSLLTFGLLNRNKGIETVIQALPRVVEKHPEVIYIILGKTHPIVLRETGEEYRNYLKRLVEKNNLRNNVYFNDRYVTNEELFGYLSAVDIYVTPYLDETQITSGTLSYAVGAGTAVISTPYWHAKGLLADGRGKLFDFGDSNALADILNELLDKPSELLKLKKKAYRYGRKTIWPVIGIQYLKLISNSLKSYTCNKLKEEIIINPLSLPAFSITHVKRLTDDTGIIQHAKYSIPNLKEGYSLDDNARALLMTIMAYRQKKDQVALELLPVYLSFIHYMQNDDGTFKNFLSFSRDFLDDIGSEDTFGRTIWALGYLVQYAPNDAYFQIANEMFINAYPKFTKLKVLRGRANTIIGICHYLHRFTNDEGMNKVLSELINMIIDEYNRNKDSQWHWFEPRLLYDNGIIPLSLFHAYEITGDEKILEVAKESMEFLEKIIIRDGYFSLVGNEKWYVKGEECSQFAQQPVDAMAMVLMYYQAYVVTRDKIYINRMITSFMWFHGENDLRIPLYDFETNGCCDGLESYGVNRNQGAESTISYQIAHLSVLFAYEQEIRGVK